jgi:hypothetical protein
MERIMLNPGPWTMDKNEVVAVDPRDWRWKMLENSGLPPLGRFVLLVIGMHGDLLGNDIRPTQKRISQLTGVDERTIKKYIDAGKSWVTIRQPGKHRGQATIYGLTIPEKTLVELDVLTSQRGTSGAPLSVESPSTESPSSSVPLSERGTSGAPLYCGESVKGVHGAPPFAERGTSSAPLSVAPLCEERGTSNAPLCRDEIVKGVHGAPPQEEEKKTRSPLPPIELVLADAEEWDDDLSPPTENPICDPFGMNPDQRRAHRHVWWGRDIHIHTSEEFSRELQMLLGEGEDLRLTIASIETYIGDKISGIQLKKAVYGRIAAAAKEKKDKDNRYKSAVLVNGKAQKPQEANNSGRPPSMAKYTWNK